MGPIFIPRRGPLLCTLCSLVFHRLVQKNKLIGIAEIQTTILPSLYRCINSPPLSLPVSFSMSLLHYFCWIVFEVISLSVNSFKYQQFYIPPIPSFMCFNLFYFNFSSSFLSFLLSTFLELINFLCFSNFLFPSTSCFPAIS